MFMLSRRIGERSSTFVVAVAVASLALGSTSAAQCSDEAVLRHLDAGTVAPVLRTPKGAAVIGGGFSLRVFDAAPSSTGILFYSAFENPVFDPVLGATVWPEPPWLTKSFGTSAQGVSGAQFNTTVVTDDLCGAFATFQAVVADAGHPSGFTTTNAVRLRVGIVSEPVFGPVEQAGGYNDVVFADVDGDALRDQVVAEASSFSVSLGLPAGGFGASVTYGDVGGSTRAPLVADLDGDGNTDLIDASGDVGVILLDASGGVLGATSFDAGPTVTDGALGDFDLDGNLDLAVTRQGGALGWMEGVGDGSLLFPQDVVVVGNASQVEAGHMDGDGQLDLVVSTSATVVALGNGDGTFTALAPTGSVALGGLSVLDLDGDGELDVAGMSGKALGVRLGNGDGSLGSLQTHVAADAFLMDYVFADLDGDGLREAIVVPGHAAIENIFVSPGLSSGQFGAPVEFGAIHNPRALAVADLDLDGALDVFVVGLSSTLTLRGLGDGSLDAARVTPVGSGAPANSVVSANLNGDAFADAVVVVTSETWVFLGGPNGLAHHAIIPAPFTNAQTLDVADFTGDGLLDILVGDWQPPIDIGVLPGDGLGNFGAPIVTATEFTHFLENLIGLHHADFDEDDILDVVCVIDDFNDSHIYFGNGDGTFDTSQFVSLPSSENVRAVGRLNGDAHFDLLVWRKTTGGSLAYPQFGNGDGTFTAGPVLSESVFWPQLADVDRDGDQDIVNWGSPFVYSTSSPDYSFKPVQVALNDGNGSFSFVSPTVGGVGGGLAIGDFDEDGVPDLALTDTVLPNQWGSMMLLRGHGDGTFTQTVKVSAGAVLHDLAAGDFDGDGILDIASLDLLGGPAPKRLWTFLNRVGE